MVGSHPSRRQTSAKNSVHGFTSARRLARRAESAEVLRRGSIRKAGDNMDADRLHVRGCR
jgi:hypothetical protein